VVSVAVAVAMGRHHPLSPSSESEELADRPAWRTPFNHPFPESSPHPWRKATVGVGGAAHLRSPLPERQPSYPMADIEAIRQLMAPPTPAQKRRIGFGVARE